MKVAFRLRKKARLGCLSVCTVVVAVCHLQANLESELRRLQKESREKQNIIDEKEEEMYELETRIEKQVLCLFCLVNSILRL